MKTNVESLVFSITTLSATLPGAERRENTHEHQCVCVEVNTDVLSAWGTSTNTRKHAYLHRSWWWGTLCKSTRLCRCQSERRLVRQSGLLGLHPAHPRWCRSTAGERHKGFQAEYTHTHVQFISPHLRLLCFAKKEKTRAEGFLFKHEVTTYEHVLSAFVSARVTVEMLSKAWFYMGTFVLRDRNTARSICVAAYALNVQDGPRATWAITASYSNSECSRQSGVKNIVPLGDGVTSTSRQQNVLLNKELQKGKEWFF